MESICHTKEHTSMKGIIFFCICHRNVRPHLIRVTKQKKESQINSVDFSWCNISNQTNNSVSTCIYLVKNGSKECRETKRGQSEYIYVGRDGLWGRETCQGSKLKVDQYICQADQNLLSPFGAKKWGTA